MPTIFDYINATEVGAYITDLSQQDKPMLGDVLFPFRKQMGLDLSYLKGSKGLPIVLAPSAFDAVATLRSRVGFEKMETELPFFREGFMIGEKERQELNKVLATGNSAFIEPLINSIYDDAKALYDGTKAQMNRMCMMLLSTGKISISANRVPYDYDFQFDASHKETLTAGATWDNVATARPVEDIRRWKQVIEDATGEVPTRAICTPKTWNYLLMNNSIRLDMNPAGGMNVILGDEDLKRYLVLKLNLEVVVYGKKFKNEAGVSESYFADDVFTLIPEGNLGFSNFGTTPEESDLLSGTVGGADVLMVNNAVAITTIKNPHPVNVKTICSAIMLPSFESIDSVFIAKVK